MVQFHYDGILQLVLCYSNKLKSEGGGLCNNNSSSNNSSKDWYDSSSSEALLSERSSAKPDTEHYQGYPNNSMPPHHPLGAADAGNTHDSSPINPQQHLGSQHGANSCHSYSPQQQPSSGGGASDQAMPQSQQQQQHYPGYPGHGMGGNMSPMSPGYPNGPRGQHPQQYHNSQYAGDPQQYGQMAMQQQQYPGQGCHMGPQGIGPHGPSGREGDPYSFVDEYTGPSPRPVDEVLGNQQPKRRGRKPKHIKLMENGWVLAYSSINIYCNMCIMCYHSITSQFLHETIIVSCLCRNTCTSQFNRLDVI